MTYFYSESLELELDPESLLFSDDDEVSLDELSLSLLDEEEDELEPDDVFLAFLFGGASLLLRFCVGRYSEIIRCFHSDIIPLYRFNLLLNSFAVEGFVKFLFKIFVRESLITILRLFLHS